MSTATISTAEVAAEARAFAREHGTQVGTRGRLSAEAFTAYFLAQPKRAREVAVALGLPVGNRGRLSRDKIEVIAATVR